MVKILLVTITENGKRSDSKRARRQRKVKRSGGARTEEVRKKKLKEGL